MKQVDAKIKELVNKRKLAIRRPVSCFVTFESQEGHDRCEYFLFDKNHAGQRNAHFRPTKFFDHQAHVKEVSEPTDIIWENLHYSMAHRRKKKTMVAGAIVVFILLSFALFAALKATAGANKMKYPSSIDCDALLGATPADALRRFAVVDRQPTMGRHGSGHYQCYCQRHSGAGALLDGVEDLCDQYQRDKRNGLLLTSLVTFLVALFNIIIRNMNMKLIDCIGYHTHSERYTSIMTSVFVTSFINTGVLLLLTNATLEYSFLSFIPLTN